MSAYRKSIGVCSCRVAVDKVFGKKLASQLHIFTKYPYCGTEFGAALCSRLPLGDYKFHLD